MATNSKLTKYITWSLVAIIPFACGIDYAYAKVGIASVVNGEPRSKQPNEAERILHIGNDMTADEVIKTGSKDRAHIVFLDGSSLTVGPNSQITIDKFIYDTAKKTGMLSLDASRGVFRYVGGAISKTSEVTVKSPSATMGIRGGIGVFTVNENGDTSAGLYFGKSLSVTAQGVTKTTYTAGTQITVRTGQPPTDPVNIPPSSVQQIDQQFQMSPIENTPTGPSLAGIINGSGLPDHNSRMSPVDIKNQIEETKAAQDKVHTVDQQEAVNLQGAGPIQGRSPLQLAGPLEGSGPMQSAGPLQNAGPLAAATPLQQTGPINPQMAVNLTGTFPGMNMPTVSVTDSNFLPYIPGIISNNSLSTEQLQSMPENTKSNGSTTTNTTVNVVTYSPNIPPMTPLPPVIFNPTPASNLSPN